MNDNRSRLLEIAEVSVQRTGLKALSFRTLADVVGIKSSSVHYHFPEKSDLARTLIEQYRDKLILALDTIKENGGSLRTQFLGYTEMFSSLAGDNRICLLCMMASEVTTLSTSNQALLASVFAHQEAWLTALFDDNRHELATDLSSRQLAEVSVSGLNGALLVDRVMGSSERLESQKAVLLQLMK